MPISMPFIDLCHQSFCSAFQHSLHYVDWWTWTSPSVASIRDSWTKVEPTDGDQDKVIKDINNHWNSPVHETATNIGIDDGFVFVWMIRLIRANDTIYYFSPGYHWQLWWRQYSASEQSEGRYFLIFSGRKLMICKKLILVNTKFYNQFLSYPFRWFSQIFNSENSQKSTLLRN